MKQHTPMTIHHNYNHVYRVGYCDLSKICKYIEPQYYNAGSYGWNCDIYVSYRYDIMICTGYRNMRGKTIPANILKKYNAIAVDIINNRYNYEKKRQLLEDNYYSFLQELFPLH